MTSDDQYKKINSELIKILKELLAAGNWENSLFLRKANEKLQELCNDAVALAEKFKERPPCAREKEYRDKAGQGYIKVFISIYQSDPYHLQRWESTLKSIREYSSTRPIHRSEEYVQESIRAKQSSINEGYAVIYVREADIVPHYGGKTVEDKWGHELLTLRSSCLSPNNIVEFVHQGKNYAFREGKLVLKSTD